MSDLVTICSLKSFSLILSLVGIALNAVFIRALFRGLSFDSKGFRVFLINFLIGNIFCSVVVLLKLVVGLYMAVNGNAFLPCIGLFFRNLTTQAICATYLSLFTMSFDLFVFVANTVKYQFVNYNLLMYLFDCNFHFNFRYLEAKRLVFGPWLFGY